MYVENWLPCYSHNGGPLAADAAMIEGTVNEVLEPIVTLTISGPVSGNSCTVQAVIDTGFNDFLTLPFENIASLALVATMSEPIKLADGSIVNTTFFKAGLDWHGKRKPIVVQMAPGSPLLGMRAMEGSRLTIGVNADGAVTIEEDTAD